MKRIFIAILFLAWIIKSGYAQDFDVSNNLNCKEGSFVPLRQVYFKTNFKFWENGYILGGRPKAGEELARVLFVLSFYKIGYKVDGTTVLINCATWKDQDIMANFTRKAEDVKWLKEHHYPGLSE